MRNTSKKLALPALAAATAALSAAGMAKADFVLGQVTTVKSGLDVIQLQATNNGANGTGTQLESMDVTMVLTSSGAMTVNMTDIDGDGVVDANILGYGPLLFNKPTGTFAYIGSPTSFSIASVVANGSNDTSSKAWQTDPTGAKNPGGTPTPTQTVPARYSALTSLEIAGFYSGGIADTSAQSFANLVVPVGATGYFRVGVAGATGNSSPFVTITFGSVVVTQSPIVSLTATTPTGMGTSVGDLEVIPEPGNGHYQPVFIHGLSTPSGYATVSNFNPSTDTEVFLLKLSSSADDAAIINDINTVAGANPQGFLAEAPAADLLTMGLASGQWDIELIDTSPGAAGNGFSGFNLANVPGGVGGIVVTDVMAIPEPTSLSLIVLSGIGLLARRRRK